MKFAFFYLAVLGICVHDAVGRAKREETSQDGGPLGEKVVERILSRLLKYPVMVLKIVPALTEEKIRQEMGSATGIPGEETDAEEPATEDGWQVLEPEDTGPAVKSLITVPNRCKDGMFVMGRCRQVFK